MPGRRSKFRFKHPLPDVHSSGGLRTHHILIEKVDDHVSQAAVAPVSMNQEEFLQVLEVRNGKIARHDRLQRMKRFRQEPVAKERLAGSDFKTSVQTCMPSCPEIPMPISAAWIMLTSLAPSPIATAERSVTERNEESSIIVINCRFSVEAALGC